jgi:2-polyprenyl-3-methyl-5-hydroxy-6-metoxy-1,4-benzoquinol methylase
MSTQDQFAANRALWNARVPHHLSSRMYDVEGFVAGRNSLTVIELELLGDVKGKDILHLQCHFGQDTLCLARMGARVTGLDISDAALAEARKLAERCGVAANWVESNVIDHRAELDGGSDIVFTSYGTIGWLPDLRPWAANIARRCGCSIMTSRTWPTPTSTGRPSWKRNRAPTRTATPPYSLPPTAGTTTWAR